MVNCIPNNDERPHERSINCWCGPRVDWLDPDTGLPWEGNGPRIIHNAADSRETAEEITGESLEPGKGWSVFED